MTSRSEALRELKREADGPPRQTEIFTQTDWAGQQEHLWCYVVQHRVRKEDGGWEPWESDTKPAHFRTEDGAKERMWARLKEMASFLAGDPVIEFRVAPKWLGYVPDGDEKWILP